MKTITLLFIIIAGFSTQTFAGEYEKAMGQNIAKLFQTNDFSELASIANTFDRIGEKENEWLPFYYSSYAHLSVLFFNGQLSAEEKHSALDKSQAQLDKAIKIDENQSEIHVLQAFIYQMRITDASLGYQYSTLANQSLAKAKILNPDNPRYYYLKGTNLFHTPEEYGGGKAIAKPLFEKASQLFSLNKHENSILPSWGTQHNQMMLNQCK